MRETILEHAFALSILCGLGLLVLAAYVPAWWLILPGWTLLVFCIAVSFSKLSEHSPYRNAFYLMIMPVLFFFGFWEGVFTKSLQLIFEPSLQHLGNLLMNRSFLVLTVLYFAAACLFHNIEAGKRKASIDGYEKECERLRSELKQAGQPNI